MRLSTLILTFLLNLKQPSINMPQAKKLDRLSLGKLTGIRERPGYDGI